MKRLLSQPARISKPQFNDLFQRRYERGFVAFALPRLDGEDIRYLLLIDGKAKLRAMASKRNDSLNEEVVPRGIQNFT